MATHNNLGHIGEDFAVAYLNSIGYRVIARNWHHRQKEIDIIAVDGQVLVFVEVKTRTTHYTASDVISQTKIGHLEMAAEAYIRLKNFEGEARFDLIILTRRDQSFDLEHIREAFR